MKPVYLFYHGYSTCGVHPYPTHDAALDAVRQHFKILRLEPSVLAQHKVNGEVFYLRLRNEQGLLPVVVAT